MPILKDEVPEALKSLAKQEAPPDDGPLFQLAQNALADVEVDLARVEHLALGRFVAKRHRKSGYTEETVSP